MPRLTERQPDELTGLRMFASCAIRSARSSSTCSGFARKRACALLRYRSDTPDANHGFGRSGVSAILTKPFPLSVVASVLARCPNRPMYGRGFATTLSFTYAFITRGAGQGRKDCVADSSCAASDAGTSLNGSESVSRSPPEKRIRFGRTYHMTSETVRGSFAVPCPSNVSRNAATTPGTALQPFAPQTLTDCTSLAAAPPGTARAAASTSRSLFISL